MASFSGWDKVKDNKKKVQWKGADSQGNTHKVSAVAFKTSSREPLDQGTTFRKADYVRASVHGPRRGSGPNRSRSKDFKTKKKAMKWAKNILRNNTPDQLYSGAIKK